MQENKRKRHASFAELGALLAYRNRPELEEPIVAVKTNWTVIPANDNASPEEIVDYSFERHLRITPSVEEIMRNVAAGPVERNSDGQVVGIGRLRFSDGKQTERAYCYGPEGKLMQYDAIMPPGSMLHTRDKADGQLGGSGYKASDVSLSNYYFADMLGTADPKYVTGKGRKNGKSITAAESAAILADAYANTPVLPDVKRYPKGLPCGSSRPTESFVGMRKGKKGESGAIAWEDIATSMVNREIWDETLRSLSERDIETLDAAMEAKKYADIGVADGQSDNYADKKSGGRKRLMAANDNLLAAMKIFAT